MNERRIILNRIQTPDGTILTSFHRHDFKLYKDSLTGEEYLVDGGTSYIRRSENNTPYKELSIYSNAPFIKIREAFHWGTKVEGRLDFKPLCELEIDHIENVLEGGYGESWMREYFKKELVYREAVENFQQIVEETQGDCITVDKEIFKKLTEE